MAGDDRSRSRAGAHDRIRARATGAAPCRAPTESEAATACRRADAAPRRGRLRDAGTEERPLPPPSILESVISELLGAVPEVRDHVLEAADALLDAAKALLDAADRVRASATRRRLTRGRHRDVRRRPRRHQPAGRAGRSRRHRSSSSAGCATPETLDGIVDAIAGAVRGVRAAPARARALGRRRGGHGRPRGRDPLLAQRPRVPEGAGARRGWRTPSACPTVVDNDANVAVVAELAHGAARGLHRGAARHARHRGRRRDRHPRARCCAARTGSAPRSGTSRSTPTGRSCACGQRGHWEAVASGTALGRARAASGRPRARRRRCSARRAATIAAITGHARGRRRAGRRPPTRSRSWPSTPRHVAVGLVGLVNILDPELVVVSGGLVELGDVLLAPGARRVRRSHRGRARTVPRCRSCRPSSAVTPASSAPRCWRGSSRERRVKVGITLPSFRDDVGTVARGGGRGRGERARRRVRVRPPVPARPRRASVAPRSRCSR